MSPMRLLIGDVPTQTTTDDIVWQPASGGPSSLHSNVDPDLATLGRVLEANRDAFLLAVCAFLADRTTRRPKGWQRNLQIQVPVADVPAWQSVRSDIEQTLSFLTSDEWSVAFVDGPSHGTEDSPPPEVNDDPEVNLVCLFSGGSDSMCGAIKAMEEGQRITLVSHWDWTGHAQIQCQLAGELREFFGASVPHVQVHLGRKSTQINGSRFTDEPTRRSRSLLFITLGLAVASIGTPLPMWIAENGFASLNLPLAPERRASLSTRTTHPVFLDGLRTTLQQTGAHSEFSNPFATATKGEMFTEVASLIGKEKAADLLSKTHSCVHVRWAGSFGRPPSTHCGVCFGCRVRRAGFVASGLEDRTTYLTGDLSGKDKQRFLAMPGVRSEVETARYAMQRDIGPADILALELPSSQDVENALDLVRRGFAELARVTLP